MVEHFNSVEYYRAVITDFIHEILKDKINKICSRSIY